MNMRGGCVSLVALWILFVCVHHSWQSPSHMNCDTCHYGDQCSANCGHCRDNDPCDVTNGHCPGGCVDGYGGPRCDDCEDGNYGNFCKERCGHCLGNETCDKNNGHCPACLSGWRPPLCWEDSLSVSDDCSQSLNIAVPVSIAVGAALLIVIAILVHRVVKLRRALRASRVNDGTADSIPEGASLRDMSPDPQAGNEEGNPECIEVDLDREETPRKKPRNVRLNTAVQQRTSAHGHEVYMNPDIHTGASSVSPPPMQNTLRLPGPKPTTEGVAKVSFPSELASGEIPLPEHATDNYSRPMGHLDSGEVPHIYNKAQC